MIRFLTVLTAFIAADLHTDSMTRADDATRTGIMVVRGRSAEDLAKVAAHVLDDKDVRITSDDATNVLIIRGSADDVTDTLKTLQTLDPLPKAVSLDVQISVADPETDRKPLQDSIQLTMLDQNTGKVMAGQDTIVATGTQMSAPGRYSSRASSISTGTMVTAVPRVSNDGVIVELQIEKSWLEYGESSGEGKTAKEAGNYEVFNISIETTLRIAKGRAEEFSTKVTSGDKTRAVTISVSADVDRVGGEAVHHERPSSREDADHQSSREPVDHPDRSRGRTRSSDRRDHQSSDRRGTADPSASPDRTEGPYPDSLFKRLDANNDGNISNDEREGLTGRFLERLGFGPDEEVTADEIRNKIEKMRKQRASAAE